MLKAYTPIVTGSRSFLGGGSAGAFAGQGCNIVLNGFGDAAEIESLRQRIAEQEGVEVRYSGADLSKPDEIAAMVAEAEAALGGVDILVNNAGIQHTDPVEAFPPERWDAVIAINLTGAFHCIRAALPKMRERGWGRVVNIASAHGLVASVNKSAYVAAKHGVVGLTKVVALETAEADITCNAICPGWVLTPLVEQQIEARAEKEGISVEQAEYDLLCEKQPSKKFATVEQIGELAVFLCGPGAAQITGTTHSIDGGWTAQ